MATITITGTNALDEAKRKNALQKLQDKAETDVLEILANAASKAGANDKVRKYKHFL